MQFYGHTPLLILHFSCSFSQVSSSRHTILRCIGCPDRSLISLQRFRLSHHRLEHDLSADSHRIRQTEAFPTAYIHRTNNAARPDVGIRSCSYRRTSHHHPMDIHTACQQVKASPYSSSKRQLIEWCANASHHGERPSRRLYAPCPRRSHTRTELFQSPGRQTTLSQCFEPEQEAVKSFLPPRCGQTPVQAAVRPLKQARSLQWSNFPANYGCQQTKETN